MKFDLKPDMLSLPGKENSAGRFVGILALSIRVSLAEPFADTEKNRDDTFIEAVSGLELFRRKTFVAEFRRQPDEQPPGSISEPVEFLTSSSKKNSPAGQTAEQDCHVHPEESNSAPSEKRA